MRWAGGIRFQAWWALRATSTVFQGISVRLSAEGRRYAAEKRSATRPQSTVFHHASM